MNKLTSFLIEALVTTDKALALNMGFEELVQWSTDDDTLMCCDGEMLLCMPSKDFEKINNSIKWVEYSIT